MNARAVNMTCVGCSALWSGVLWKCGPGMASAEELTLMRSMEAFLMPG